MKSRIIVASEKEVADVAPAYDAAREQLELVPPSPPSELTGDLLLAMVSARPRFEDAGTLRCYGEMFHRLAQGRRWSWLVGRLAQLAWQSRDGQGARANVLQFLGVHLSETVVRIARNALPQNAAANGNNDPLLEALASRYIEVADEFEDFSELLLDDLTMTMLELARRLRAQGFQNLLQNKELVEGCLRMPCDPRPYAPRFLREVMREGSRAERIPGDNYGLRGTTKKIREDQIPKLLPSELAGWHWNGEAGKRVTMDRIVNGAPAVYQFFNTQRPELNHKMLVVFLVNTLSDAGNFFKTKFAYGVSQEGVNAEVIAKSMAFSLLVHAALKVPHQQIQTEVAWFLRDASGDSSRHWAVRFPLSELHVTGSNGETWRNVAEVDRILPYFLVRILGTVKADYPSGVSPIKESLADFLARASTAGYDAMFVVALGQREHLLQGLPAASVVLPCLPDNRPSVMLVSAEGKKEGKDTTPLRGETFRDLLSAHLAPGLLSANPSLLSAEEYLNQTFLEMILGPVDARAKRLGSSMRGVVL
jgi:hypothetical protein